MVTPPPSLAQIKNLKKLKFVHTNTQIQIKTFMLFFFGGARWILCAAEGIIGLFDNIDTCK